MDCEWIAVDWGTTRLRAWSMAADTAIDAASNPAGMSSLSPEQFEPALLALVGPWLDARQTTVTDVIACGMVGARQGWAEAPYRAVPCTPTAPDFHIVPTTDPRIRVHIAHGLKQDHPADVMRGEETQIAGYLSNNPDFDGVLCLPGTHTKWVHVSAGEVVSFRTFMTGEMFALLSTQSVLRHTVGDDETAFDEDAFGQALSDAMSNPEAIAARLFGLRADGLLKGLSAQAARSRLSGYLLGTELAAARPYWLGRRVVVIGTKKLAATYVVALSTQGIFAPFFEGDDMSLQGLTAAYHGRVDHAGSAP